MPFKPNYNQRRSERQKAQQQKHEEKEQRRAEKVALRKAERGEAPPAKDGTVARKRRSAEGEFVLYDVTYEDGTRSSNRRVARAELDALDADASARAIIEAQDEKIAAMSGRSRGPIKAIMRSAVQ